MWQPSLEDYVTVAARILEVDAERVRRLPGLAMAESALAAPFAGVGDQDAYPSLELKAAVLLERLVGNHPLPDGNKRAAFVTTVLFLERNRLEWCEPDVAVDAEMVERAAAGETELAEIARWVTARTSS